MASLDNISEKKFETIFEYAPDAIYVSDQMGNFIDGNQAAEILTGYKREELIGKSFLKLKLLSPNEIIRAAKLLALNLAGKSTGPDELTLISKDGQKTLIEIRTFPIVTDGNKQILGIARDISNRKKEEQILHDALIKFKALFESSRDAIMTLEPPSWNFTSGNPATIEMFRTKNEQEFISKTPGDLSPQKQPDGRASDEKAKEMITAAMNKGSNFFKWTHKRINGEEFPANVLLTKVGLGSEAFLQATVRDITEQKRVEESLKKNEEKLKESEQEYRALFESSADGILVADIATKKFKNANLAICKMFGYTEQEFKKMSVADIHPKDKLKYVLAEFEAQAKGLKTLAESIPCLKKDGSIFHADINTTSIESSSKKLNVGFFRDITQRKMVDEDLRLRTLELERFNKLAVDRELKMIELKKKIIELEAELKK